jgi:hypothetical protein
MRGVLGCTACHKALATVFVLVVVGNQQKGVSGLKAANGVMGAMVA